MSHYLLVDAADGLRHSASALRLSDDDASSNAARLALVYVIRAETALECENGLWSDCRDCEGFLNDAAKTLSSDKKIPDEVFDKLYTLSCKFYKHVTEGAPFEYDGELTDGDSEQSEAEADEEAARKIVKALLGESIDVIGKYGDNVSFASDDCYVTVKGEKVFEFAFSSGGIDFDGDEVSAAENIAQKCGYELTVYSTAENDGVTTVKLCDVQGGAYCRDECASVVIADGKIRAFSAGHCGNSHDVPSVKVDETTARRATKEKFSSYSSGEGRLVTTHDGERDRICYEYRYELDDGEHFVYVCAENGRQMQVR